MSNSLQPHRRQPTRLHRPWDSLGKNTGVGCHFLLQCMKVKSESEVTSHIRLFSTPWTAAYHAPLSMGFSRQEYWSGVPLPSPPRFGVGPKSKDWYFYKKEKGLRATKRKRQCAVMHLQSKMYQRLPAATRGQERSMGWIVPPKGPDPADALILDANFLSCGRMNFCCSKPPDFC